MKLNPKALSLASGIVSALVFALCAILIWLWPKETMQIYSWWGHIDLTGLAREVTILSFLGGTILSFILGYVLGWLFVWLYNRFSE